MKPYGKHFLAQDWRLSLTMCSMEMYCFTFKNSGNFSSLTTGDKLMKISNIKPRVKLPSMTSYWTLLNYHTNHRRFITAFWRSPCVLYRRVFWTRYLSLYGSSQCKTKRCSSRPLGLWVLSILGWVTRQLHIHGSNLWWVGRTGYACMSTRHNVYCPAWLRWLSGRRLKAWPYDETCRVSVGERHLWVCTRRRWLLPTLLVSPRVMSVGLLGMWAVTWTLTLTFPRAWPALLCVDSRMRLHVSLTTLRTFTLHGRVVSLTAVVTGALVCWMRVYMEVCVVLVGGIRPCTATVRWTNWKYTNNTWLNTIVRTIHLY